MAAGDLTTVEKVRDFLGLADTSADTKIAGYVTSSSKWVVSQLGRPILTATYTETHNGDGGQVLVLDKWPINSVTSVTVDGEAIVARATVDDTGYVIDGTTIRLVGYYFTKGTANVVVVYSAGYATCPEDLQQAVTEHAALRYRDADRSGLASASIAGESAAYSPAGALAYINGVLDLYREPSVA